MWRWVLETEEGKGQRQLRKVWSVSGGPVEDWWHDIFKLDGWATGSDSEASKERYFHWAIPSPLVVPLMLFSGQAVDDP
jgi:hypothetical protein